MERTSPFERKNPKDVKTLGDLYGYVAELHVELDRLEALVERARGFDAAMWERAERAERELSAFMGYVRKFVTKERADA